MSSCRQRRPQHKHDDGQYHHGWHEVDGDTVRDTLDLETDKAVIQISAVPLKQEQRLQKIKNQ
jgi:hypothetical protein